MNKKLLKINLCGILLALVFILPNIQNLCAFDLLNYGKINARSARSLALLNAVSFDVGSSFDVSPASANKSNGYLHLGVSGGVNSFCNIFFYGDWCAKSPVDFGLRLKYTNIKMTKQDRKHLLGVNLYLQHSDFSFVSLAIGGGGILNKNPAFGGGYVESGIGILKSHSFINADILYRADFYHNGITNHSVNLVFNIGGVGHILVLATFPISVPAIMWFGSP
ncbi:hypothetical protein [Helicobacter sp. T3_23-1056]